LGAGTDTLPQNPGDQATPLPEKPGQSDRLRHQAVALLDHHRGRTSPPSSGMESGTLPVGDIRQVINTHAPISVRDATTGAGRAERAHDRTRSGDRLPQPTEPPFAPTRDHLVALAQEKYGNDPAALAALKRDMADFEKRMMGVSPVEVQRTYTQLSRLLEGQSSIVSGNDRMKLAQQILQEAAHPEKDISQGLSDTCAAASLESRAYTKTPGEAAKMVADIALTGSYTTADGRKITPSTGISHPYANDGMDQPGRNFANQIFQVTAMNIYVDMLNQSQKPPGHYRYALVPSKNTGFPFEEHLFDDSKHPAKDIPFAGVKDDPKLMAAWYNKITGASDQNVQIPTSNIESLEDFKNKLNEALRSGQFPMMVTVFPNSDPVSSEFEKWKKSPSFAEWQKQHPGIDPFPSWFQHAITIQGYDPRTGKVTYQDPSLSHETHQTDIATLLQGMGVSPWPESEDRYFAFMDKLPKDAKYSTASKYSYLALLPPAQRQEEFKRLTKMQDIDKGEFTDEQLAQLGLQRAS